MRTQLIENRIYYVDFSEDGIYHIYNRTNNKEALFIDQEDYLAFLAFFKKYLEPICIVYAYCLIPNHFHFLVQFKSKQEILAHLAAIPPDLLVKTEWRFIENQNEETFHFLVGKGLSRMFGAYSRYFNKTYNRKGNLFNRRVKRRFVFDDVYFNQLMFYVFINPEKHGLTKDYKDYKWSSVYELLYDDYYLIKRKQFLAKVGGKKRLFRFVDNVKRRKNEEGW